MLQPGGLATMIGVLILPLAQKATDKSKVKSQIMVSTCLMSACCAVPHYHVLYQVLAAQCWAKVVF